MSWQPVAMVRESGRRLRAAGALAAAAAVGCGLGMALAPGSEAAQADSDGAQAEEARAEKTFEAPAGMILNYVRANQAAAFESLTNRLLRALADSEDGEHQAQAAGWKVYKALEPGPNGDVLFVWLLDPAVAEADYSVAHLLRDEFPADVQGLYERYNRAFGLGQALINLEPTGE